MKILSYFGLVQKENGVHVQKGMNHDIKPGYAIVLMSTKENSPYEDELLEDGKIKYEGEDVYGAGDQKKVLDQVLHNYRGTLTENGKFMASVNEYKSGQSGPRKIQIYRKIRNGIWVDMGFYNLIDGFFENNGSRNVCKFILDPIIDENSQEEDQTLGIDHNRFIPGDVMREVYERDQGKCVVCGSMENIHLDHKIPFSKGGSSKDPRNIQLLCQACNLAKSNRLDY